MASDLPATARDQQGPAPASRQATLGLIFVLLVVAAVLFVVWLARTEFVRDYAVYDVELSGRAQGLSVGSAVYMNGVRTGEVTKLGLDPKDPAKVMARIRVSADTPVRQDSTAGLEWLGVSGSRIIQLSGGALSRPLLKEATAGDAVPVIRAAPGTFGHDNPDKPVATQALEALDMLNQRLSDRNLTAIGESLAATRTTARSFRDHTESLAAIDAQLVQATRMTDKVGAAVGAVNDKVQGDLGRSVRRAADSSADAVAQIKRARAQLAQGQASAEAGLQALPALTTQAVQVQGLVEKAGDVIDRFDSGGPVLGAPPRREIELKP